MIDLDDCYDSSDHFEGDPYLVEMYKLCMLLSRASAPSGSCPCPCPTLADRPRAVKAVNRVRLTKTTDEQLERILSDFDQWRLEIPEALQFAGADSSIQAGVLHSVMVAFEVRPCLPPFASLTPGP